MTPTSQRKSDHIKLAFDSIADGQDSRFCYEPLLSAHPDDSVIPQTKIGNKISRLPFWVSSMTGGAEKAGLINHRIAEACGKFGMGMGLGSCRIILENDKHFPDFDLRDKLGNEVPFMANLGIAQIEQVVKQNNYKTIENMVHALRADGLIIHVNPLQEWLQPEGDLITRAPIDTITTFIKHFNYPVWVKEVGQGFGRKSLKALIDLPIAGIEFGAYGGTNFAKMESMRTSGAALNPLAQVGHNANEMVEVLNLYYDKNPELFKNKIFVVSGGVKNFLDGYYYIHKLKASAIYAQASPLLKCALESTQAVEQFIASEKRGLMAAYSYLTLRS
ncbi:MAG: isopentenyl-diphosphate delta-isomerase [Bacteroidetes bacterium]|nr:isopentenyl-diphosphate delta-isomerase [Bacteroidota bacterium]